MSALDLHGLLRGSPSHEAPFRAWLLDCWSRTFLPGIDLALALPGSDNVAAADRLLSEAEACNWIKRGKHEPCLTRRAWGENGGGKYRGGYPVDYGWMPNLASRSLCAFVFCDRDAAEIDEIHAHYAAREYCNYGLDVEPPQEETTPMPTDNASPFPPEFIAAMACANCGHSARSHVEPGGTGHGLVGFAATFAISGKDITCAGCKATLRCPKFKPAVVAVPEVVA